MARLVAGAVVAGGLFPSWESHACVPQQVEMLAGLSVEASVGEMTPRVDEQSSEASSKDGKETECLPAPHRT